jgi:hypothetical protein
MVMVGDYALFRFYFPPPFFLFKISYFLHLEKRENDRGEREIYIYISA